MTTVAPTPVPPKDDLALGEPYCGACGHRLTGLVDSSRCPECGRPIVEVVTRAGKLGTRYRSTTTLFGLPLVDVAFGATHTESAGLARGVFAIGDNARGIVAIGGHARGVVAIGGTAVGVFSVGGLAFGLLSAWGGVAVGALAAGGLVLGLLTFGGLCVGIIATGGICIGVHALGGLPIGYLVGEDFGVTQAAPAEIFQRFAWFLGKAPISTWSFLLRPNAVVVVIPVIVAAITGLAAVARHLVARRAPS